MRPALPLAIALAALPLAAAALPAVGDRVGTTPGEATAALEKAGCAVRSFEAEDGRIEAKCVDPDNARWEIYIDPASGTVTRIKAGD